MNIYVTDGNNRASLAITRSLGKKGHRIFIGEKNSQSLAGSSKYCYKSLVYPDPSDKKTKFVDVVIKQLEEYNIDVVIPVADVTTFLLIENREQIIKYSKLPIGDHSSIRHAADKKLLVEIATSLDIPIPNTFVIDSLNDFSSSKVDLHFPLVIKPSRSRVSTNNGWLYTSVSYATNQRDLESQLRHKDPAEFPILLQEKIEGPGIGVFTCFKNGKPIALFSHKRLREKPPSGGTSVLRESIPVDPVAARITIDLLKQINWHGVAMVEFKLDTKDQIPKLMEINGRFWGSLQLAIDAGVDFPDLLVKSLEPKEIEPVLNYKLGVKSRWLLGDLDVLLLLLLKPRISLNLPSDYPGRLLSLFRFLKFWGNNQKLEVFRINDIKPFLFELRSWLKH